MMNLQNNSPILVIVGPTTSGKSDLAIRLAKKFDGEIISADSRQVYKGLNIGTNKITQKEMRNISHHLLGVINPNKQFSVAEYKKLAEKSISNILKKGKLPIIVGGTGFYIDVLIKKVRLPNVKLNKPLRKKLEKYNARKLFTMLQKSDAERARTIDQHNRVRLIRALEIVESLGKVPKIQTVDTKCQRFIWLGLTPNWLDLEKRIYNRLLKQLPSIIRESKKLHSSGLSYKRMFELGLEYRYVAMYLQKKLTRDELEKKLYTEIRRYAKRQMTWFKRNKEIKWFKPTETKKIIKTLKRHGIYPKRFS